jgi:hypothetical protein
MEEKVATYTLFKKIPEAKYEIVSSEPILELSVQPKRSLIKRLFKNSG